MTLPSSPGYIPEPLKAEPALKSNQCYFQRHSECWMSKLCECKCHQEVSPPDPTMPMSPGTVIDKVFEAGCK